MKKKKLDIFNLFYSGAAVVILVGVIAKLLEWPAQDLLITGGLAIEALVFGVSAIKFVEVEEKNEVATEATLAKVADGLGNLANSANAKDTYINIQTGTPAAGDAKLNIASTVNEADTRQPIISSTDSKHTIEIQTENKTVEVVTNTKPAPQPVAEPVVEVTTRPAAKTVQIEVNTNNASNVYHSLSQLEQLDILSLSKDLFFQPEWDKLSFDEYFELSNLFKRVFDKKLPNKEALQFLLQFPVKLPIPEMNKLSLTAPKEVSVNEIEVLSKALEVINYNSFLEHFIFEHKDDTITIRPKKSNETQIFGGEQELILNHVNQFYPQEYIVSPNIDCLADMIKLKGRLLVEQLTQKVSIKSEDEFISLNQILLTQPDDLKKKLFNKVKKLKYNLSTAAGYSYLKTLIQSAISFRETGVGQELFKNVLEIQIDDSNSITIDDVVNYYADTIYFGPKNEYSVILNELFVKGELNNLNYVHSIIDKLVADNVASKSKLLEVFNLKEQDSKKDVFNKLNYHLNKTNTAPSGAQLAFILLYKQYS